MTSLAARDQENLVHGHLQAAAAKPLNQGIKGLPPKTPGAKAPKTPFKVALNDENAIEKAGKTGKKGAINNDAFITPAGPRTRAPLGAKTTNAKAKAFQTPAPLTVEKTTQKTQQPASRSPRLRRAKVKVHTAPEPTITADDEEEEPEIEFMPPRGIPLKDEPPEWPSDMDYSILKPENFPQFYRSYFVPQVGPDGLTQDEREEKEAKRRADEVADRLAQKAIDEMCDEIEYNLRTSLDLPPKSPAKQKAERIVSDPVKKPTATGTKFAPGTIASKSAAAALSNPANVMSGSKTPHFAAPTAAAKARVPAKKQTPLPTSTNPSSMRHSAATAASKSTLGYSTGRAVNRKPVSTVTKNTSRRPLPREDSQSTITPAKQAEADSKRSQNPFVYEEELMNFLRHRHLDEGSDECGKGEEELPSITGVDDEEDGVFQFAVPTFEKEE